MTGFHAARVAARMKHELGIEVDEVEGHYGEFTVLVDGEPASKAGIFGFIGALPSSDAVLRSVREGLGLASG